MELFNLSIRLRVFIKRKDKQINTFKKKKKICIFPITLSEDFENVSFSRLRNSIRSLFCSYLITGIWTFEVIQHRLICVSNFCANKFNLSKYFLYALQRCRRQQIRPVEKKWVKRNAHPVVSFFFYFLNKING